MVGEQETHSTADPCTLVIWLLALMRVARPPYDPYHHFTSSQHLPTRLGHPAIRANLQKAGTTLRKRAVDTTVNTDLDVSCGWHESTVSSTSVS